MGDIIGAIFGTSSTTTQQTVPDPIAQALNMVRLNQAVNLFSGDRPLYQFADPNTGLSTPTDFSTDLMSIARNEALSQRNNLDFIPTMDFNEYLQSFDPVRQNYERSVADVNRLAEQSQARNVGDFWGLRDLNTQATQGALARSYGDYSGGLQAAGNAYGNNLAQIDAAYQSAVARGDYDLARSIQQSQSDYVRASQRGDYDTANAIAQAQSDYVRSAGVASGFQQRAEGANYGNLLQSLDYQESGRQRALDLGTGAVGNYIDRIATPRLNQALTLQGLEGGGAVPNAIARATAETAIPFLQSIEQAYGSNVANTLAQYLGVQGNLGQAGMTTQAGLASELGQQSQAARLANLQAQQAAASQLAAQSASAQQQAAAGNVALGQQRQQGVATAGNTYQNNIAQLAQALMQNNITLEQAGIAANSTLGQQLMQQQQQLRQQQIEGGVSLANTFNPLQAQFTQSLPQASAQLAMTPLALSAARTANLNALQPLADFPRALQEADYLRRQGLFQTVYTGIPFSPGSTTAGGTSTGNIFDQLGGTISSGVTGGKGGFSTLGTKT
jgi:hypothetical protein